MENNAIFMQRKDLKKKSHAVFRGHYLVLVFLTLVLSLFGLEFTLSTMSWGNISGSTSQTEGPANILEGGDAVTSDDIRNLFLAGQVDEGIAQSDQLAEQIANTEQTNAALGRTNGVLAQIVNASGSGKLFVNLAKRIRGLTHSDTAVSVLFTLGSLLWTLLIITFIKNVYSAVVRRVYLEARVYEKVSFLDVTYFAAVRKWVHASWVMLVKYIFQSLWDLTIIGGFIKRFSYFAVPYIVAENPTISARDAIKLSRKMMDGHKMELFKYMVTMFGWVLLAMVTFGISDMLYGAGYRLACQAEFYAKVREQAREKQIEGVELLNDPYLFEKADKILLYETYFEVVDEITILHENKQELKGARKVIADWLGVWLGSISKKRAYDDYEGRKYTLTHYKRSMDGLSYPEWLNPLWRKKEIEKQGNFSYLRHYTIWTLFLLFIAFCFVGWSWEVALHFMQTGQFANRGTLHGPWLPIYGTGGIIVLMLCSYFRKNPVAEFFTAILLCGVLEYTSAWYLETKYHTRWWSYDGYFLNLHGRICAEGLLVFGVGCCIIVYLIAPLFDFLLMKIKEKVLIGICLVLAVIYGVDFVYSQAHPNMAEGAIEADETPGETPGEALTELSS